MDGFIEWTDGWRDTNVRPLVLQLLMWFSRNFPHAVSEIKVVYLWVWGLQYRWSAFAWQWPCLSNWLWMWVAFSVARLRIPSWPFVYGLFCTCWFMLNSMPGGGSWVGATKQWNRGYEDCLFVTPWSTHHFSYTYIYIDNIKIPNHLEICKLNMNWIHFKFGSHDASPMKHTGTMALWQRCSAIASSNYRQFWYSKWMFVLHPLWGCLETIGPLKSKSSGIKLVPQVDLY